ncbi:hypothetical protein K0M31_014245 [Melipona bicolor]|uniref:Uncharacterized protein n=1 Tax=Melipona bicolor TaxID=60889 RepID=A0AA40G863_9HYME|nr:hypothetical protein K0M31_014245 [Melipona bicolor]
MLIPAILRHRSHRCDRLPPKEKVPEGAERGATKKRDCEKCNARAEDKRNKVRAPDWGEHGAEKQKGSKKKRRGEERRGEERRGEERRGEERRKEKGQREEKNRNDEKTRTRRWFAKKEASKGNERASGREASRT